VVQLSRYDVHAPWFMQYSHDWAATSSPHLPPNLTGTRVLDLACGWAVLSRELADRGAIVTGVELSEPLLERARAVETTSRGASATSTATPRRRPGGINSPSTASSATWR
jgi:2-polyprenyl-3-methyl-5-hydroxy-6-metoxy-1,4-benzoquinol methylase